MDRCKKYKGCRRLAARCAKVWRRNKRIGYGVCTQGHPPSLTRLIPHKGDSTPPHTSLGFERSRTSLPAALGPHFFALAIRAAWKKAPSLLVAILLMARCLWRLTHSSRTSPDPLINLERRRTSNQTLILGGTLVLYHSLLLMGGGGVTRAQKHSTDANCPGCNAPFKEYSKSDVGDITTY